MADFPKPPDGRIDWDDLVEKPRPDAGTHSKYSTGYEGFTSGLSGTERIFEELDTQSVADFD